MPTNPYYVEQLEKLEGYTITCIAQSSIDEHFGLTLRKGRDRVILWIYSDETGEKAGAFEIDEYGRL